MNAKKLENWILDNYQGEIVIDVYRESSLLLQSYSSMPKRNILCHYERKTSNLNREGID